MRASPASLLGTGVFEALPLFPLPTVLFPGAQQALHVFEPRYRAMVRDILASDGAIGIVFVTGSNAIDAHGHPPIAAMAGAGFVVDHRELPNGRYEILVQGCARVALEELPFVSPYRRARARVVPSTSGEIPAGDATALRIAASSFAARMNEHDKRFQLSVPEDAAIETFVDLCAASLVIDARERQALLETLDPAKRARRLTEALIVQRVALSTNRHDLN